MGRPSLELRMGQQLTLTPALQQSIRLLQLSTLDLEAEIAKALSENPMLETADEFPAEPVQEDQPKVSEIESDFQRDSLVADNVVARTSNDREDEQPDIPETAQQTTLRDYLLQQLGSLRLSRRDSALVALLIEDLDDDGFLESSLEEIHGMLDPDLEIELQELQIALTLLQSFDPPGVGARSLPECLLLQLRQLDLDVLTMFKDDQVLGIARKVCESYLEMLAAGQLNRICELLGCTLPQLQQAYAGIRRLDPKPGSRWNKPAADYAIPDVIARKKKSGWQIELNEAIMPRLRVNDVYARMLGSSRSSEYAALQGQLQEARWLIRNVSQRFETILRVSQAIASHQKDFFDQGWVALRPLTLRDISAELGLHESTVSRATTQKYMLTPFGTIELKRFFVGGLSTEGGESTSAIAVQTKIREFIQAENPVKPLSDAQLVKMLQSQGITIARRTVAKYREQMRIPTASLRKSQAGLS